uniref:Uncharacterized protein n=1 Tax=Pipistrellus kuhlii TaxID=59472 RepID=A0A7J7W3J5_PIPKU|nr:hypothetical protein mPipKuh1_008171 [Pipistrellus kuhlii]
MPLPQPLSGATPIFPALLPAAVDPRSSHHPSPGTHPLQPRQTCLVPPKIRKKRGSLLPPEQEGEGRGGGREHLKVGSGMFFPVPGAGTQWALLQCGPAQSAGYGQLLPQSFFGNRATPATGLQPLPRPRLPGTIPPHPPRDSQAKEASWSIFLAKWLGEGGSASGVKRQSQPPRGSERPPHPPFSIPRLHSGPGLLFAAPPPAQNKHRGRACAHWEHYAGSSGA